MEHLNPADQFSLFDTLAPETPEEYNAFVEKFKPKRTTDDCYTPDAVYDVVAEFVVKTYGVNRDGFVRPFFPGGDYEHHHYPDGCVVVDNPPFSILANILAFYATHGVRFFLFAPALTLFSAVTDKVCAALPTGINVTFDNGAELPVSFLTNLEPEHIRVKTYPELYTAINRAVQTIKTTATVPRYEYPDEVITAAMCQRWCKYGISYELTTEDCMLIGALDAQRRRGKAIFGKGYLLSERAAAERAAAERAAAERAAAERAAAERWELSERERYIVEHLGKSKR